MNVATLSLLTLMLSLAHGATFDATSAMIDTACYEYSPAPISALEGLKRDAVNNACTKAKEKCLLEYGKINPHQSFDCVVKHSTNPEYSNHVWRYGDWSCANDKYSMSYAVGYCIAESTTEKSFPPVNNSVPRPRQCWQQYGSGNWSEVASRYSPDYIANIAKNRATNDAIAACQNQGGFTSGDVSSKITNGSFFRTCEPMSSSHLFCQAEAKVTCCNN